MIALAQMVQKLRHRARRFGVDDGGQSLLELAVATPFLLLLLAGCVDYGRFMYDGIQLGNAAKAGVAYGAQDPSTAVQDSAMIKAATNDASGVASPTATATQYPQCSDGSMYYANNVNYPNGCATPGHPLNYVSVTVSGTFVPMIQLPGLVNPLTITKTAVEQVSP